MLITCVACQWKNNVFEVPKTLQSGFCNVANPMCHFILLLLDVDKEKLQFSKPSAGIAHDLCHYFRNIMSLS